MFFSNNSVFFNSAYLCITTTSIILIILINTSLPCISDYIQCCSAKTFPVSHETKRNTNFSQVYMTSNKPVRQIFLPDGGHEGLHKILAIDGNR